MATVRIDRDGHESVFIDCEAPDAKERIAALLRTDPMARLFTLPDQPEVFDWDTAERKPPP